MKTLTLITLALLTSVTFASVGETLGTETKSGKKICPLMTDLKHKMSISAPADATRTSTSAVRR